MSRKRWPPSAVLNTREAAHHVGLAPGTLAKARIYGGGPAWTVLLKGAVRYRVADLDAWLAVGRRDPKAGTKGPKGAPGPAGGRQKRPARRKPRP